MCIKVHNIGVGEMPPQAPISNEAGLPLQTDVHCSHTFKLKKLDIVLSAFIILDDFALDYVHYVVFPVDWFAAEDYIHSTDDVKSRLKGGHRRLN